MQVIPNIFRRVACNGEDIHIRAVQAFANAVTRVLVKSGVALFGLDGGTGDKMIEAFRIIMQGHRDAGKIAKRVISFFAVHIQPSLAVVGGKVG
jgi:hypothetical protein